MSLLARNAKRIGFYFFNSTSKIQSPLINPNTFVLHEICYPVYVSKHDWNSCRLSHTFLSRVTANQLWKGVTSVSAAGRKKGRGKRVGRRSAQDLNKGQVIGFGKINMVWPGLTGPVVRGKEVVERQELPPDEIRQNRIIEMRDRASVSRRLILTPLERGWCGNKLPGRSLGPPAPIGEETFEGFDSRVLQFRTVMKMSGQRGRVRSLNAFVVVGNKNGLAGFGLSTSANGMTAAYNARDRAAHALRYIQLHNGHTVLHDFHSVFGASQVFVFKKPKGYGLVCHRVIKAICEMLGIKDLYCKIEGSTKNTQNVTKAFFIGLMRQKSPEEMVEEKKLHLVQFRKDREFFPEVVASPKKCRTDEEIGIHEMMDFRLYCFGGRVREIPKPFVPFYANFPTHLAVVKSKEKMRNHHKVKVRLTSTYGSIKSFINVREEERAKKEVKEAVES